jgi:hypothetical protein
MSYYRTESGGTTSITTYSSPTQMGEHFQNPFQSNIPIKYQEVARLAVQYSGKSLNWLDDKFILIGIKNLLMGR